MLLNSVSDDASLFDKRSLRQRSNCYHGKIDANKNECDLIAQKSMVIKIICYGRHP